MGGWSMPFVHIFNDPGHYDVKLAVRDNINSTYFEYWCYYEVYDPTQPDEFFEVHIHQDYYAKVGEKRFMEFVVVSHFATDKVVQIEAFMETPSGNFVSFYYNGSVTIPAFGTWTDKASFLFDEVGPYTVILEVTDETGTEWKDDCWWEISEEGDTTTQPDDKTTTTDTRDTTEDDTTPTLTPGFELFLIPIVFAVIYSLRKRR
jgi:hypothetical protein